MNASKTKQEKLKTSKMNFENKNQNLKNKFREETP